MCDNCFQAEIKKFKSQDHWTAFDLELSQKLGQEKLRQIRVVTKMRGQDEELLYVYQCLTCGQKWKLEEPYEYGDGHFVKLSTFGNLVNRELSGGQIIILLLVAIIGYIIVRVILW